VVTQHTDLHKAAEEYRAAFTRWFEASSKPEVLPIQLKELELEEAQALQWLLEAKALDSLNRAKKEEPKQLN